MSTSDFTKSKVALIAIVTAYALLIVPLSGQDAGSTNLQDVQAAVDKVKNAILKYPGGLELESDYFAVEPSAKLYFDGKAPIKTVLLWPRLFHEIDAKNNKGYKTHLHRISVYDFEKDESIAFDDREVHVVHGRHMFSTQSSLIFRSLNWAEGYQVTSPGSPANASDAIPEVLSKPEYSSLGIEFVDGERCLHVGNDMGDDIWLAQERGFLLHRRETRTSKDGPLKSVITVDGYQPVSPGLWLPTRITTTTHSKPNSKTPQENQLWSLCLEIKTVKAGKVDPAIFDVAFPKDARVTDLIRDKQYFIDKPTAEAQTALRNSAISLLWVVVTAILTVIVLVALQVRRLRWIALGNYVKPRRRILGVLPLVLACVITTGWVRSLATADFIVLVKHRFMSMRSGLYWEQSTGSSNDRVSIKSIPLQQVDDMFNGPDGGDRWGWRFMGFGFSHHEERILISKEKGTVHKITDRMYRIPYWSAVIPWIIVSWWLLLPKPTAKSAVVLVPEGPDLISANAECTNRSIR